MKRQIFEAFFQKPEGFIWSEGMQCYFEHKDFRFKYKENAIHDFNQRYLGWLAAQQCIQVVVEKDSVMYSKDEFESYKEDEECLTVDYWYGTSLESIDHITYEDYVNTFTSFVHIHKGPNAE